MAGQYTLALVAEPRWKLDGGGLGHLLWVMPWMLFILQPAPQRIDSRLILIAQNTELVAGQKSSLREMSAYATPYADCLRGGIFSQYCAVYADAGGWARGVSDAHH